MPLSPADDLLLHQTPHTFDHVGTSDRNFYDRHYFNLHGCSDEVFLIAGVGQYPNLGVSDAFITISVGTKQYTVRASRELGSDRLDTTVGPLGIEVVEGLRSLRFTCEPNEWGIAADLTFTGTVDALEEPRTFIRSYERVQQDVSRYAQVGVWSGEFTVAGQTFTVTPDRWKGVRDRSWGVRPVGEPEAPGIRARQATDGHGFRHDWIPMQFDDHLIKIQVDQDADGHRHVEESMRVWNTGLGRPVEHLGRPEIESTYISGTREIESAVVTIPTPDGDPVVIRTTPLRTLYLAAGSGYAPDGEWGHGYYQGPLKVEGVEHDFSQPEQRRRYAILNETLSRFESSTGEVGYGLHENMLMGVYRPSGFDTADAVAP